MQKPPSEIHQDLTAERINEIGTILARARYENLQAVDDRDDGWSIGCRAYTWCRSEIIEESTQIPYLSIVDPGLKFIFKIGGVEVSIYKGESSKPKKNIYSRAQSFPELKQISLLENECIPEKLFWAYAIETDLEGNTTNIEFFGAGESGDIVASHTVPIHNVTSAVITPIKAVEAAPVELPAAAVSLASEADSEEIYSNEQSDNISG